MLLIINYKHFTVGWLLRTFKLPCQAVDSYSHLWSGGSQIKFLGEPQHCQGKPEKAERERNCPCKFRTAKSAWQTCHTHTCTTRILCAHAKTHIICFSKWWQVLRHAGYEFQSKTCVSAFLFVEVRGLLHASNLKDRKLQKRLLPGWDPGQDVEALWILSWLEKKGVILPLKKRILVYSIWESLVLKEVLQERINIAFPTSHEGWSMRSILPKFLWPRHLTTRPRRGSKARKAVSVTRLFNPDFVWA